MLVELTEQKQAILLYMTNELYEENHSVIAKHFPIKQDAGRRLVDSRLLSCTEYVEISSLPENVASSRLYSLTRKGDDSIKTFSKVLVSAKGKRDVDFILHHLEADARSRKDVSQRPEHKNALAVYSRSTYYHPLLRILQWPIPGSAHTAHHK